MPSPPSLCVYWDFAPLSEIARNNRKVFTIFLSIYDTKNHRTAQMFLPIEGCRGGKAELGGGNILSTYRYSAGVSSTI